MVRYKSMAVAIATLACLETEFAEAEMAVGHERTHAEFLG
jgi:hypothetical protein